VLPSLKGELSYHTGNFDEGADSSRRLRFRDKGMASSYSGDPFGRAVALLREFIDTEKCAFPPELLLAELVNRIREAQQRLIRLARCGISRPASLDEYPGDVLKELQTSLHALVRKAERQAKGEFACSAECMGDLSQVFEVLCGSLQAAMSLFEQRKKELFDLSESLQREVAAGRAVEEHLRQECAELEKLASTDTLTGLFNRRHFFHMAGREAERIRRTNGNACLAMLDIDNFKTLNDSFGHSAGDKALRRVARLICGVIRSYDIVGRYGGDEFVFLFPELRAEDSRAILERLRRAVEKAKIPTTGESNSCLTVSIGLTELGPGKKIDKVLDEAVIRADKELYKAKKQGSRNSIFIK
jgi:diguanylate cyclase (GGDEF)-like protein